jgi:hypothetical protein
MSSLAKKLPQSLPQTITEAADEHKGSS